MTRSRAWVRVASGGLLLFAGLCVAAVRPAIGRAENPPPTTSPATVIGERVVDETGQPVAGAAVNVTWFRKAAQDATTDPDGRFSLSIAGPIRTGETVRASADGGNRLGIAEYREPMFLPNKSVTVVFQPSRALTARVVEEAGKPVANALVEVQSPGNGPLDQAATGNDGVARFRLPADGAVNVVEACKDGVGFDYFENYQAWPTREHPPLAAEVMLALDGARTVTVKIVNGQGQPVPGARGRSTLRSTRPTRSSPSPR